MSHLLALSIGPVQDFIAAARRTQDLQAGSDLLVQVAKAAARSVQEHRGELIFPAGLDADGPNKILAEMPDGQDPAQAARDAREAAQACLSDAWAQACRGMNAPQRSALDPMPAQAQVEGFLEFYAAWLPCTPGSYGPVRKELDRLLAGRKALRDFAAPPSEPGRAKSPLDPSRDCVFPPQEGRGGKASCRSQGL